MSINKDTKLAVVRPAPDKMKSIANYLPLRAKCVENLRTQILPSKPTNSGYYTATIRDRVTEENVKVMLAKISTVKVYGTFLNVKSLP